jgi:hypothetical protein
MSALRREDIEAIVAAKLAGDRGPQCDDVGAIASRTFVTMLASLGIEHDDRRDIRADLDCLRRWRTNIEQAKSYAFNTAITAIVTGFLTAIWLGINVALGR